MFPDFKDFARSISNEDMNQALEIAKKQVSTDSVNTESYIVEISSLLSLYLLQRYHLWLEQNFQNPGQNL